MKYYLDCEFNGFDGSLLSLALVREDGHHFYAVLDDALAENEQLDPWVDENVVPILLEGSDGGMRKREEVQAALAKFLYGDTNPVIITDWPDDIKYFCELAITGPGTMINVQRLSFEMHRVDAYPTTLPGAIQHNALWDAKALRHLLNPSALYAEGK